MNRPAPLATLTLVLTAMAALAAAASDRAAEAEETTDDVIRLLPPPGRQASGRVLLEALLIDPDVWTVVFYVDGESATRRKVPPWEARVRLDSPPREQYLRVEALDKQDRLLGFDEIVVNRVRRPLRVAIGALDETATGLRVEAEVSVPEEAELESVAVFLNEDRVGQPRLEELDEGRLTMEIPRMAESPQDFVRVEARLADGRTIEDVELVAAAGFQEELDVRLVQLQVLVTDKRGYPVEGLSREDFEVREKGRTIEPAGVFMADDVSLLLGLTLDSSGSMRRIWTQTQEAAASFLRSTLLERDQGFLVDFDTRLRLVRSRTADKSLLLSGLSELEPEGGTALYDSILFSLLQFERQQGRRGLVVLSDGFDVDSRADPERTIEFGKKLGVPIYILAMEGGGAASIPGGQRRGLGVGSGGGFGDAGAAVGALRVITDPTGGRLYRVRTLDQMLHAFAQINAEMRNQYVLTYYTDDPPQPGEPPDIRVRAPDRKGVKVKTVFGGDQIY